ncbi:MAG: TRAP transporter large permease [Desulfovibrio sp.]|nr:TRAP transporter large permease [Desulfovibrio sp.]
MSSLTIVLLSVTILFLLGMPIFMSLAIAAAVVLIVSDLLPLAVIHNTLYDGLNIFPLLAIPSFVVAGTLMERGNITNQIIDVVKSVVGNTYGGIGITTVLACAFFAAITGSGSATVAAVGSVLIPAMLRNGYSGVYAGSVTSTGGSLGILIPPSNPMIIYAIICNLSVTGMFTAGFIPGFITAGALCVTAYLLARKQGYGADPNIPPVTLRNILSNVRRAFFSLCTVIVVLGSIYTGLATPVEASIIAVAWALFVGSVINRALTLKDIYDALLDGAMICGSILLIVGTSTLFGKILVYEEAPTRLAAFVLEISSNKYVVLLMLIAMLYLLGMFMETLATIILVAPVLIPVLHNLQIDPIHFGIILIMATQVGLLTPPLGVNLFVASRLTNVSVEKLAVGVLPYIGVMTLVILLITFIPEIATWLPYALGYGK